jgi:branched-chain amino acid transport system permease protein
MSPDVADVAAAPQSVVHPHVRVRRATRSSWAGLVVVVPLLALLGLAPYGVSRGTEGSLVTLFSLIVMATMWNLLAGYGGMVSIGQQAYLGLGAYALVYISNAIGLDPFIAVPAAVVFAGVVSIPVSYLAFRLSGGYFAIGTWVVAEVVRLVVMQVPDLGAGSGISLAGFAGLSPGRRIAYVYWLSLVAVIVAVGVTYLIMRSRLGLGFTAIRDDATAAATLGVRVTSSKRFVYVVAAMGTALAGSMIAANTLRVQPESAFSISYSAFMIFIVVIGGIGTVEGPIVGAIILFALQQWLSDLGTWYLVVLGAVAIVVTLFLPRGVWGLISGNGRIRLFPVGYRLVDPRPRFAAAGSARAKEGTP